MKTPLVRCAALTALLLAFAGCPQPVVVAPVPAPATPTPTPTPPPVPTPPPPPYVPAKKLEVGKIFNGMQYRVRFETEIGTTATADRNEPGSYVADLTVRVKVPKANREMSELMEINAELPNVLPGLGPMLDGAKISPAFDNIYRLKCASLQASLNRLDNLLTRHNFFDCETILELQHPESKRRALLIQADMDTDMDGSDPDRAPEIDGTSATFQPMTSYRWDKKSPLVNSFIPPREAKIVQYELELAANGVTPARKLELTTVRDRLRTEIGEMKRFSFLVAHADPFIVVPGSMVGKNRGAFAPGVGDYAVVIYGRTLYPAIVGDVGPSAKVGEASLRIGREINARTSAEARAVNDLKVTYLVFPGTGERPWGVPDLAKWRARCEKLLGEIGGHEGEMFTWEDVTKPKPATPAPQPPAAKPSASVKRPAKAG